MYKTLPTYVCKEILICSCCTCCWSVRCRNTKKRSHTIKELLKVWFEYISIYLIMIELLKYTVHCWLACAYSHDFQIECEQGAKGTELCIMKVACINTFEICNSFFPKCFEIQSQLADIRWTLNQNHSKTVI